MSENAEHRVNQMLDGKVPSGRTYGGAPKQTRSLAAIVEEMVRVIDEADGEVTARVDELELELEEKAQAYVAVMRQLGAESEAFHTLAHEYRKKSAARDAAIEGLKFRLDAALKAAGVEKLKTPSASIYYQPVTSVVIANEREFLDTAEDRFVRVTQAADRVEIKKALEAGETVEHAEIRVTKHIRYR